MKLISMTDFVLEQSKELSELPNLAQITKAYMNSYHYAQFLKQPLTLSMFVPCDEEGNVLEEPKGWNNEDCNLDDCCHVCKCEQYKQAKERVLFEGFKISSRNSCINENLKILRFDGSNEVWAEIKDNEARFSFPNLSVKTIEDMDGLLLELTETAIKQIGL